MKGPFCVRDNSFSLSFARAHTHTYRGTHANTHTPFPPFKKKKMNYVANSSQHSNRNSISGPVPVSYAARNDQCLQHLTQVCRAFAGNS